MSWRVLEEDSLYWPPCARIHANKHTELDLDVALLDLGMDGEQGWEVTLWTEAPELPVWGG